MTKSFLFPETNSECAWRTPFENGLCQPRTKNFNTSYVLKHLCTLILVRGRSFFFQTPCDTWWSLSLTVVDNKEHVRMTDLAQGEGGVSNLLFPFWCIYTTTLEPIL